MVKCVCEVVSEVSGSAMDDALRARVAEWPADLFALTSAILAESGAYRLVVSPPSDCRWPLHKAAQQWANDVEATAQHWITWIYQDPRATTCPIGDQLSDLFALAHMPLRGLEHKDAWE